MGFIRAWLSQNQLFKLFFFHCFFQLACLNAQPCTREQTSALLQFRSHFSFDKRVSEPCDDDNATPSHPKLASWKEGTDCCSWDGVQCDNNETETTGQVIGLDLSCSWLKGSIHPNSTLFHSFPRLQRLNLAFNDFSNSRISSVFSRFAGLTHLNLSYSGFFGEIPIEVSFLTQLVSLDLSGNFDLRLGKTGFELLAQNLTKIQDLYLDYVKISTGFLNPLLNLTSLTRLGLQSCGLHGKFPDEISHLPHMEELRIGSNYALSGYLPKFINSSSPLRILILEMTSFSGELPDSIGNLKSLKDLLVSGCKFYGSVPVSLGNLTNISYLLLSSNNFTGTLPSSLSKLQSLICLDLSHNSFHGRIADVLPNSKCLSFLFLNSNNFSGPLPFPNLTELVVLEMSNNHLTGPLPSQITGLLNLEWLQLSHNLIDGTIPSWVFSLPTLQYLDLGYNKLTGHLNEFQSASVELIDLSHNNMKGAIPSSIFELEKLTYLILSSNNFRGYVELHKLCHAIFLKILDLSNNSLSGMIPQCLGNLSQNLVVIDLRKNNLSGTIPDTFAIGNTLTTINLNGNRFEGPVPKSLVNCTKLEVLDLGSNKLYDIFPHWLEILLNIHVLVLRSNKFHGPMPTSKAKIPFLNLRVIDISDNYFTGPLPKKYFENFKAMMNVDEANFQLEYLGPGHYYHDSLTMVYKGSTIEMVKVLTIFTAIDLSNNKFEGEIPDIIGRLNSTRGLNLSHNSLTSYIPPSLGNLRMLEWLDLSSNKLIGGIPQQLTNLKSLEVLNLSWNKLIGPIPQGKQFDTFSNDSYTGNLKLCGPPLSNTCSNSRAPQPPSLMFQQEEDSPSLSGFDWKVILPGYGCGLVFGLVVGYLLLSTGKP